MSLSPPRNTHTLRRAVRVRTAAAVSYSEHCRRGTGKFGCLHGILTSVASEATAPVSIPDDLISLAVERRVIPFVGAGFSSGLGLPSWETLLTKVAGRTDGSLTYEELERYTDKNLLQIAEYLYLKSYGRIGPIRHIIEQEMPPVKTPIISSAHVELVNLGAPQIYTTNYDDLIEDAFRALGLPVNVVTLARDVALAAGEGTQVVKYHGDLRHDETLVLTESSYYKRLDFESPMDLKFRSDLLGRSVLFMGYSFRDVNIRVIWFKLMQMMKDIPQSDRRPSYIVRLDRNPVLEELDHAVGLRTIVLDPDNRVLPEQRPKLLGQFLYQLAANAFPNSMIPGRSEKMYVSTALIEAVGRARPTASNRRFARPAVSPALFSPSQTTFRRPGALRTFYERQVPEDLLEEARGVYLGMLTTEDPPNPAEIAKVCELARRYGPSSQLTIWAARVLLVPGTRGGLLEIEDVPWDVIWGGIVSREQAIVLLNRLASEIEYNKRPDADDDIAYAVDIASRIAKGHIADDSEAKQTARQHLDEAAKLYPSVNDYEPDCTSGPKVESIVKEVNSRLDSLREEGLISEDEGPWDMEDDDPF